MNTGKVILVLVIAVITSVTSFAQSHDEPSFGGNENARIVELFPNPVVEVLTVRFEIPCARRVKLSVHNIIGNTVEVETETVAENEIQIKVRDLPTGYYLLSIRDPDTSFKSTLKFLKR